MNVIIQNFMRIRQATIEFPVGITLLAGENGSGKTSVLRAMTAALTATPIPTDDGEAISTKGNSRELVHGTEKMGFVEITGESGTTRLVWPSNGVKPGGPQASPMVCGQVAWMRLPQKERIRAMQGIMERMGCSITITPDDIRAALAGVVSETTIQKTLSVFEEEGRDLARVHARLSGKWTETKGQWRETTGETYGAEKAREWTPPKGWSHSLLTATKDDLQAAIEALEGQLAQANRSQGASQERLRVLREKADRPMPDLAALAKTLEDARQPSKKLKDLEESLAKAKTFIQEIENLRLYKATLEREIDELEGQKRELKQGAPSQPDGECPSCHTPLIVERAGGTDSGITLSLLPASDDEKEASRLNKFYELDRILSSKNVQFLKAKNTLTLRINDQDRAIQKAMSAVEAERRAIQDRIFDAEQNHRDALAMAKAIESAKTELAFLEQNGGATTIADPNAPDSATLAASLNQARVNLTLWEKWKRAGSLHTAIVQLGAIREALAPDGIEKKKLESSLQQVNAELSTLCSRLKWPVVSINSDMEIHIGGHPYRLASRGMQFRAQVALQLLVATAEHAPVVLIDGADILDAPGRSGLVAYAREARLRIVVAMTCKLDYAQEVSRYFQSSYWLADGSAQEIQTAKKAAA